MPEYRNDGMMRSLLLLSLTLAFWMGTSLPASAKLRLSGILGQSQPAETIEPLPDVSMRGIACDPTGHLWSFSEDGRLRCFGKEDDRWVLARTVKPPSSIGAGELQRFNEKLIYAGTDRVVYLFDPVSEMVEKLAVLPEKTLAFTVDRTQQPYRCLALLQDRLVGLDPGSSGTWAELFPVDPPRSGKLQTLAVDPLSGEILIGTTWPDCKIRVYGKDGTEPRHPVSCRAEYMAVIDDMVWGLLNGARTVTGVTGPPTVIQAPWSDLTTGLTHLPDGSWWIATSQGLLEFDALRQPTGHRIGGLSTLPLLSVAPDGTLIAYDRGRMLRLSIDAAPDAPLHCGWREPFRVGANWRSHACAMRFDGTRFLVLDDVANRLWAFDPWHTGWRQETWLALCPENTFKQPTSLAVGDCRLFVADAERGVLTRRHPGDGDFVPMGIAENGLLAANLDGMLWVAAPNQIDAYRVGEKGNAELCWQQNFGEETIKGLAAGESILAVIHGNSVCLLAVTDGSLEDEVAPDCIPGGMEPVSIAILEPWILVGDAKGRRILRFRRE